MITHNNLKKRYEVKLSLSECQTISTFHILSKVVNHVQKLSQGSKCFQFAIQHVHPIEYAPEMGPAFVPLVLQTAQMAAAIHVFQVRVYYFNGHLIKEFIPFF